MALIELGDQPALVAGLRHAHPVVQRAALMALDQIAPDAVPREEVLAMLGSVDPLTVREAMAAIADAAIGCPRCRPTGGRWLAQPMDDEQARWLQGALAAFSGDMKHATLIADQLCDEGRGGAHQADPARSGRRQRA